MKKINIFSKLLVFTFFFPPLYLYFRKQLKKIPEETQIFLMTRCDFGTFIYLSYYARCWQSQRGNTCLVLLTPLLHLAMPVAECISPHTHIIAPSHFLFRIALRLCPPLTQEIFNMIYGRLHADYPNALRLFELPMRASYIESNDHRLKDISATTASQPFLRAYKNIRKYLNYWEPALLDFYSLQEMAGLKRRLFCAEEFASLGRSLHLTNPFVVINLNCKRYPEDAANRKAIKHPERYSCLIDFLISQGYSVVLQGRNEQPIFRVRKGLIDYARSGHCSVENDLALYSHAAFAITNKTGPECFCMVANTPQLGLNYTEIQCLIPNAKLRYFPKHIINKKLGREITWQEHLASPGFFDISSFVYDSEMEYSELEEEELMAAVTEFLPLVPQPDEKWLEYTPQQQEFRSFLTPLHLDLFETKGVPCNVYLQLKKRRT